MGSPEAERKKSIDHEEKEKSLKRSTLLSQINSFPQDGRGPRTGIPVKGL